MKNNAAWQCAVCDYRNAIGSAVCEVCETEFSAATHRVIPLPPPEVFADPVALTDLARRIRTAVEVETSPKTSRCLAKAERILEWLIDYYGTESILQKGIPLDFLDSVIKSLTPNYPGPAPLIDCVPQILGRSAEIVVARGPSGRTALLWRASVPAGYEVVAR